MSVWEWLTITAIPGIAGWVVQIAPAAAWPIAVLLALNWFRKEIRAAILSVEFWKFGPFEARRKAQLQAAKSPDQLSQVRVDAVPDPALSDTAELNALIERIESELADVDLEKQKTLLVQRLAESRLLGLFEWINNAIFGSQIGGLQRLVANGGSATLADAERFYKDEAEGRYPAIHKFGFSTWLDFLKQNGLVNLEGDKVTISDRGRAFIKFLSLRHAGETKLF